MLRINCVLLCVIVIGCSRPVATPSGGTTEPAEEPAAKDLRSLQGSWRVVRGVDRGKPVSADELPGSEFEFQGETFIGRENGKEDVRASFKIDTTQKPRVLRVSTGEKERPFVEFIYEVDGDALKLAFAKNGAKRPSSFELQPGADVQIAICERKK